MLKLRPREGIQFPDASLIQVLEHPLLPRRLLLPLRHSRLDQAEALVRGGEHVEAGQALSRALGCTSRPVLSPLGGMVNRVAVRSVCLPPQRNGAPAGPVPLPCVELSQLEASAPLHALAWRQESVEQLKAGLNHWALPGEEGLPLDLELDLLPPGSRMLLLATAPAQALMDVLLERFPAEIAQAVELLAGLGDFREAILVTRKGRKENVGRLTALLEKKLPLRLVRLHQGHPWDHPRLVALAAGCPLPDPNRTLAAQGILVLGLDRLWQVWARLVGGWVVPPFWTSLELPGAKKNVHERQTWVLPAWPGTPLTDLLETLLPAAEIEAGLPVFGHSLEGPAVPELDMPLLPGLRLVTLLPRAALPKFREEACISCGQCLDVCPMRLAPIRLSRLVAEARLSEARELGLEHCLDCGLCSWICPSRIHLGHGLRMGLHQLREAWHGG